MAKNPWLDESNEPIGNATAKLIRLAKLVNDLEPPLPSLKPLSEAGRQAATVIQSQDGDALYRSHRALFVVRIEAAIVALHALAKSTAVDTNVEVLLQELVVVGDELQIDTQAAAGYISL